MNYTDNLNLKKPEADDFYSIDDFNHNADVIDRMCSRDVIVKAFCAVFTYVDGFGDDSDSSTSDPESSTG